MKTSWRHSQAFWAGLERRLGDTFASTPRPPRFEAFLENAKRHRDDLEFEHCDATGQHLAAQGNFPGLTARPVHDARAVLGAEQAARLLAQRHAMRDELLSALPASEESAGPELWSPDQFSDSTPSRRSWDEDEDEDLEDSPWLGSFFSGTYGKDYGGISLGAEEARHQFPVTTASLQALGALPSPRLAIFARQAPKSGVARHSDGVSYLIAIHLPLVLPNERDDSMGDYDDDIGPRSEAPPQSPSRAEATGSTPPSSADISMRYFFGAGDGQRAAAGLAIGDAERAVEVRGGAV